MGVIWWRYGVAIGKRAGWGRPVGRAAWRLRRSISSWQRSLEAQGLAGRILASSATAAEQTNRNAGFIRQAGECDWGGRMNSAFRWWCQDPPARQSHLQNPLPLTPETCYAPMQTYRMRLSVTHAQN